MRRDVVRIFPFLAVAIALAVAPGCGGSQKGASGGATRAPGQVTAVVEGAPQHFLIRVTRGAEVKVLVDVPAPTEGWDQVTADVTEVAGSGGRVFLAQMFTETGEDELTRSIDAWIVDAARDEVLWNGQGTYTNSFGECETMDVPEPSMENGALVVRIARGTEVLEPETDRCTAVPVTRTEAARVTLK